MIKTFELLGFQMIREREHIVMVRDNGDGTQTLPRDAQSKSD
ncbi:type II toxin-antitoxin system HicA family toxin [Rippkaea orientalis]|nr:type II toxin-antitoxin system HicA family toxin [Rippkaea orientalis]